MKRSESTSGSATHAPATQTPMHPDDVMDLEQQAWRTSLSADQGGSGQGGSGQGGSGQGSSGHARKYRYREDCKGANGESIGELILKTYTIEMAYLHRLDGDQCGVIEHLVDDEWRRVA